MVDLDLAQWDVLLPVEHGRVDDGRTAVAVQRVDRIPLESYATGCWKNTSFDLVISAPMYFKEEVCDIFGLACGLLTHCAPQCD